MAENTTPTPNAEASRMDENPSRMDLVSSSRAEPVVPSSIAPMMVSAPMQKSRKEVVD